mmetsp:Transcript_11177/g.24195  ORF Transcript_11177/g.24195 Transcript_11177/m.24195 type:complete len:152 (+) Transcript_11177:29-484(+)
MEAALSSHLVQRLNSLLHHRNDLPPVRCYDAILQSRSMPTMALDVAVAVTCRIVVLDASLTMAITSTSSTPSTPCSSSSPSSPSSSSSSSSPVSSFFRVVTYPDTIEHAEHHGRRSAETIIIFTIISTCIIFFTTVMIIIAQPLLLSRPIS